MATSQSRTEIRRDVRWRLVLGGIGIAIGLALCVVLLHLSGHGVDYVTAALRRVNPGLAVTAGLAMAVNYMLAAKKWQRVEASLSGSPHTFVHACAATAIGMGVGQVLPTVVSSALVRGLGNRAVRRSGRHGAIASGWEQLFDLAVAGLLVGPCIVALVLGHIRLAVAASAAALLAGELCCVGAARLLVRLARLNADLATPRLSKFLWRVSVMRIGVLMAVTVMIGRAFALNIPPWQLATAVPAVVLASVLSFIPAGLGVNELTFVGLLGSAGTPVPIAAAFALLNRTLQVCIAAVLAICGCALVDWRSSASRPRAGQDSTEREFEL
jgi:uncharacterized membrane protein YbhN (UPF0104 family)